MTSESGPTPELEPGPPYAESLDNYRGKESSALTNVAIGLSKTASCHTFLCGFTVSFMSKNVELD
jgi:hypothetical protein